MGNSIPVAPPPPTPWAGSNSSAPVAPSNSVGNSSIGLPIYAPGDYVTLVYIPRSMRRYQLTLQQEGEIARLLKFNPHREYEVIRDAPCMDVNGNSYIGYELGGVGYWISSDMLAPAIRMPIGSPWQAPVAPSAPPMPGTPWAVPQPTISNDAQPVVRAAEITKGRFISDAERNLIETRIALRKKLHGG